MGHLLQRAEAGVPQPELADESGVSVAVRSDFQHALHFNGGIVLDEALAGGKVDDEDVVGPVRVGLAERAQGHGFACEHEEGCLGLERRGHEASDRDALSGKVFYLVGKLEPEDAAPAVQFVEREFRRRRFRRTRQAEQGKKQARIGEELQNLGLEVSVKSYFTSIKSSGDSLALTKKNAEIQKKLYEQGKEKNRLGLLSKYNLNQLEIAAKQAQDNVALLEASMEQLYIKLNDLMGEKADARFEYVYDVTYTPYKLSLPMEQYLNAALKKDLTVQLKELALDSAKFTKNYVGESNTRLDSNTQEYNYDTAKRNLKTAKTDKEMAIRNAYLQLQQMETQITSAQSSLTKAQADYRAAQINLRAGNVTKTAVEQAEMGVVSAQNSLNQLIYNYDMLVFTFENPSLLGNTTQAQ